MSNDRKGSDATGPGISDRAREEIWIAVSRSWSEQAAQHSRTRGRSARIAFAGLGVAAALIAGVLIGRWSSETAGVDQSAPQASALPDESGFGPALTAPYRIAVNDHFRATETLFALYSNSGDADADIAVRARELAAASRLLIDSAAGRDAEIRAVLDELELLLLQIAQLRDASTTEREIIRAGVQETSALDRMRLLMADDPVTLAL